MIIIYFKIVSISIGSILNINITISYSICFNFIPLWKL